MALFQPIRWANGYNVCMKLPSIRQERFLAFYAQTGNATEAAARAGYRGTRASLAVQGSRLKKTLRFANECSENGPFRDVEDLKEIITDHLLAISTATPKKFTRRDVIKAAELLCRIYGVFDPPARPDVNMNFFSVKDANPQELRARLMEIQERKAKFETQTSEAQVSEEPRHDQGEYHKEE